MRNLNQDNITQAVASFANTPDSRLKEIMTNLVQHLHAFCTGGETDGGRVVQGDRICDPLRPHHGRPAPGFILLSDT